MAGRGIVSDEDKTIHPQVFALSAKGEWLPAMDPVHFDKKIAGVGLGKTFAISLAEENKALTVGLIPAACGGSSLDVWLPGVYHKQTKSFPYDDAIARAKIAMKAGKLKGILWHQGESDSNKRKAPMYKKRLIALIKRFRSDLSSPNLPFVIGQLGQFAKSPWKKSRELVNKAHIEVAQEIPFVTFVSSDNLSPNPDNKHFNSASLKVFGKRFKQKYLELIATAPN